MSLSTALFCVYEQRWLLSDCAYVHGDLILCYPPMWMSKAQLASSSLTLVTVLWPWARHIYPSLVLVQPRKTCPDVTERLLPGTLRIKWNKTNLPVQLSEITCLWQYIYLQTKEIDTFIVCLFCCFTSQVNSYGHCRTVSSPNHTYFLGKLEQAVNQ